MKSSTEQDARENDFSQNLTKQSNWKIAYTLRYEPEKNFQFKVETILKCCKAVDSYFHSIVNLRNGVILN